MRRNRMALWWDGRVEAATRLLRASEYRAATPSLAQEKLRDFMCAPTQTITFMDATARNGHAALVFGEPDNRKALSYGRRWVLTKTRRPTARLHTPDRSIHSGWLKPMSDASIRYYGRLVYTSRNRELALINWIERGHVFFDDLKAQRALGEQRLGGQGSHLVERAFAALEGMMGDSPLKMTTHTYLAGRPMESAALRHAGVPIAQR